MKAEIVKNGSGKIVVPENMTTEQVIHALRADFDLEKAGEKYVDVEETIERFPYEAAYALKLAADELHGGMIQFTKETQMGPISPKLIAVPTAGEEPIQVPWGFFRLPDVEGELHTAQVMVRGMIGFKLVAEVKAKYAEAIKKLAARTREIAQTQSIYRGKAIKMTFRNEKGEIDVQPPEFMDLSNVEPPIFSESVQNEINVNLLALIRYPERAAKLKIPKRRGAMLRGSYGCGKTLMAATTAQECVAKGRTFIYIENAAEAPDALNFARQYSPALVFGEDIDRVIFGPRTKEMDRVLNTIDGVESKKVDIMTVWTTNNIELIHPAFLRPGRTDAIIRIDEPDMVAIEKLVRTFAGDLLEKSDPLTRLLRNLQNRSPAFIREVVERSKLRLLSSEVPDDELKLSSMELEIAFHEHSKEREGLDEAMSEMDMMRAALGQVERELASRGIRLATR